MFSDPGDEIVVKNDHNVVEIIAAPQLFMTGSEGQADRPIILPARWIVAPAIATMQRVMGDEQRLFGCFVGTDHRLDQAEAPGRRRPVAFAFGSPYAGRPERTDDCLARAMDAAAAGLAGQSLDPQDGDFRWFLRQIKTRASRVPCRNGAGALAQGRIFKHFGG